METKNYFARTFGYLRNFRTRRNATAKVVNELIHLRLGFNTTAKKDGADTADCLTFLMYSKENENLFI